MESQVQPQAQSKPVHKQNKANPFTIFAMVFLLLVALIFGYFAYYFYNQYQEIVAHPRLLLAYDMEELKTQFKSIAYISPDEHPSAVTLVNVEELKAKRPEVFGAAQSGDYLFVYSNVAIIYRPSIRRIVSIIPLVNKPLQTPTAK